MAKKRPVILHYKWSLDDGHVTPQILRVTPYRGIILTKDPKRVWRKSPFRNQIISLKSLKANPKRMLKKFNVKAIHIHHANLAPDLLFLKKRFKVPLIVGFRGKDATAYPRKKKNRNQLKKVFSHADLVLPVCRHLKKRIIKLGCPNRKIKVMYGGVDLSRFHYVPRQLPKQGPVRFLAVGRFVEKKGFGYLIDAFALVKKKHENIKLVLIGQGECEKEYRKKISKYGLKKDVQMVSWVDYRKIQQEYHRAHIFCAPSCTDREGNQEGIPNTLKEAMATGMPSIATNHAGIKEIMSNGVTGLLVPERNVQKLAKSMKNMLKHPEHWKSWGYHARRKIEKNFNLSKQLAKQKSYYDQVLR